MSDTPKTAEQKVFDALFRNTENNVIDIDLKILEDLFEQNNLQTIVSIYQRISRQYGEQRNLLQKLATMVDEEAEKQSNTEDALNAHLAIIRHSYNHDSITLSLQKFSETVQESNSLEYSTAEEWLTKCESILDTIQFKLPEEQYKTYTAQLGKAFSQTRAAYFDKHLQNDEPLETINILWRMSLAAQAKHLTKLINYINETKQSDTTQDNPEMFRLGLSIYTLGERIKLAEQFEPTLMTVLFIDVAKGEELDPQTLGAKIMLENTSDTAETKLMRETFERQTPEHIGALELEIAILNDTIEAQNIPCHINTPINIGQKLHPVERTRALEEEITTLGNIITDHRAQGPDNESDHDKPEF